MDNIKPSTKEILANLDFAYELHEFQMNRLERIITSLRETYGEDVFEVLSIIHQTEIDDVVKAGNNFAKKCGQNTLKDIIPLFGERNLVKEEINEKGLLFRQVNGCPMSRISREEGLEEVMCKLHCSVDLYLVQGFNENFVCEVRKSHLFGDEVCEWYIYEK